MDALVVRLADLQIKLKALEDKATTQVAFSAVAAYGGTYGPFDVTIPLVYNEVITNIGNSYNSGTGIFAAPVDGVYFFTFFYHAGGEHPSNLTLVRNSDTIVTSTDHRSCADNADNGGNAAYLHLKRGDQVHVRMEKSTTIWASDSHTSFSGHLISQTSEE
ncbi:C1q-related factor-like [Pempheris klunzingeri]|uniref:C1q-related factor-like n=1 Tax=Pempheris klunzingeri TaxID=3127111 RepID=UPI00397F5FCD